jgi:hypothetical protein
MLPSLLCALPPTSAGTIPKLTSASGQALLAEEREGLLTALEKVKAGSWCIKYVCARASDCCCPYSIQFKHNGNGTVAVTQLETHQFHNPGSAEDMARLRMHPTLQAMGSTLLKLGVKPMQVCCELNDMALRQGLLGTGSSALQQASNARASISLHQVYALAKQYKRQQGYGLTSDAKAIPVHVEEYKQRGGHVAFFQPYRAATQQVGAQPLILILQTPFQQRMLFEFGRSLVFLDATYGTNKYGFPLYALVVREHMLSCQGGRRAPASWQRTPDF